MAFRNVHFRIALPLIAVLATAMPAADSSAQTRGLVGALLGAGASAAAAAARKGPEPVKTYGAGQLRPEGLKSCLISAHQLDEGHGEMEARANKLEAEQPVIAKERAAIESEGKKEFSEQADVDRFNARLRAFKARTAAFNKNVDDYEGRRLARSKAYDEFNKECAGRSYYSSDLAAVRGQLPFDPDSHQAKK
jgi:hypothetical protein